MNRSIKNILLIASTTSLLAGCASTADIEDLRYQLRIVNKKIEDMKSTTVGQMQKRQAAASGQMDQLERDMGELKAQLEESYYLNQRLREQNKELEVSISAVAVEEAAKREQAMNRMEQQQLEKEARLRELNNKLQMQEDSVKAIQEARIKEAERKARETALEVELAKKRSQAASTELNSVGAIPLIVADKRKVKKSVVAPAVPKTGTPAKTTAPVANETLTSQPSTPTAPKATSQGSFAKGQNLYQRKKYPEAYTAFEEAATNPTSGNSVEARFMMGEALFQQKEYDKAIMQYQKVISQHATSPQAPAAMLKQGEAFEKLADSDTAKVIYKKLIKKHGSSAEAAVAEKNLSNL